jgi:glycosyltransferase involved in cell wall biosynthesis
VTTLHVVGLPHTQLTQEASVCAFTQKAWKFGKMMSRRGWQVVFYWGEDTTAECSNHFPLFTREEQERWFGPYDANTLPIVAGAWDANSEQYQVTNARAVEYLRDTAGKRDLLLLTGGLAQKPIADALPHLTACEWAAGYSGWFARFVCFESHAWRHQMYGVAGIHDGRHYDTVIPNFFDPDEWRVADAKGDHLVFVGRLIARKGVQVAAEIARESGLPLLVAGSGAATWEDGKVIVCQDGTRIDGDVHYQGCVGGEERSRLMAEARAVLAPTLYIEPFGAVAVEAPLCGTPAITTDFGAFPETVENGVTGWRIRTLQEGVAAVEKAADLDPEALRARALERYSLNAVAPLYEDWFDRLDGLWDGGWYRATGGGRAADACDDRSVIAHA